MNKFNEVLNDLLADAEQIYLNKNTHARSTSIVETRDDRFRKKITTDYPSKKITESAPIMHKLRAVKSNIEIDLIQNACNITE